MTFKQLEAFVKTGRLGSVTRAAEELYLTQPSVSQQLKELEEELGLELFNRLGRGVELSEAGRTLLPLAESLLLSRESFADEAAKYLGLLTGTLEIHASNIPGEYILPRVVAEFKKLHPSLRIVVRVADSSEVIDLVAANKAALGVVGRAEQNPELSFDKLWEDRIFLYAKASGEFPDVIEAEELQTLPLVVREAGSASRKAAEAALGKAGLIAPNMNIVMEMDSASGVREAVLAGAGASFMSEVSVRREAERGELKVVKVKGFKPITRRFYLAANKKRAPSPAARVFRDYLLAKV